VQNVALDKLRDWITADNPTVALSGVLFVVVVAGVFVGGLFGGLGPIISIGLNFWGGRGALYVAQYAGWAGNALIAADHAAALWGTAL
jgi:hypothetical protein